MSDLSSSAIRLKPGDALANGKYVITGKLGSGAMGTVYRAEHKALHRDVAIKVMHPEMFERQNKAAKRFEREARAAAQLDHPNSVRVMDFGIEGPIHYLVMEFVEGRPLDAVVAAEGPMDSGRIAVLMTQVCSALAKAHSEGTIHRDLKPQNILLVSSTDDEGQATESIKVCDFGIAKVSWAEPDENDAALTDAGSVMGTPQYMSPEQCQAQSLDARSDLYSLGCVMYFLATGQHAFAGPTPLTTMLMQIQDEPRPPSELNPTIDQTLEATILKTMAKEVAARPSNARTLRRLLAPLSGLSSSELDITQLRTPTSGMAASIQHEPTISASLSAMPSGLAASVTPSDHMDTRHNPGGAGTGMNRALLLAAAVLVGLAGAVALTTLSSDEQDTTPAGETAGRLPPPVVHNPEPQVAPPPAKPPVASPEEAAPTATVEKPAEEAVAPKEATKLEDNKEDENAEKPQAVRPAPKSRPPKPPRAKLTREKRAPRPKTTKAAALKPPQPVAVKPDKPEPPPVAPTPAKPKMAVVPPAPVKSAPPTSFEAEVSIKGLSVDGALSTNVVGRAIRKQLSRFLTCYRDKAKAAGRAPTVTIRVKGTIDESGRARSFTATGGGLAGLAGCVRAATARLRSRDAPDTGTARVSFEVQFVPTG